MHGASIMYRYDSSFPKFHSSVCTTVGWVCNKIPLCTSLDGNWAALYEKVNRSNNVCKNFTDSKWSEVKWRYSLPTALTLCMNSVFLTKIIHASQNHAGRITKEHLLTFQQDQRLHTQFISKNEHWQLLSTLVVAIIIKNEGFGDCQMTEIIKMYLNLETTGLTDFKGKGLRALILPNVKVKK